MTDIRNVDEVGLRRLRVLVVHNRYRSGQPSGEDQVVDQEMALLAAAGHQVAAFERHSDDISSMPLLDRLSVPVRVPWNGSARAALAARLRTDRPDVVHIHNTFPLLSPSVVAACTEVGVPAVATLHNYLQLCPSGTLYRAGNVCTDCVGHFPLPAVRHGCYRGSRLASIPLTANMVLNRARWWSGIERFFCISEAQRKVLMAGGMPGSALTVKHNFVVDPGVRRIGTGEHVLYLGRLTEEKGVPLLMAAWDHLASSGGIGLPLVLAGTGPLEGEVTRWARDRHDVTYVGLQSRLACVKLLSRSATVVVPSAWLEAFGLVVVEAMAAAVPCVAAAHGALAELVEDHVTGALHRPGDAVSLADCLHRVVIDVKRNLALGAAARRRYEARFTPEVGLAALLRGYESAIAGGGRRLSRPADSATIAR